MIVFFEDDNVKCAYSDLGDGNISYTFGIVSEATSNREKLGLFLHSTIELEQTHSSNVVTITDNSKGCCFLNNDGIIAKISCSFFIKTADCLPITFYNPKLKLASSIHAGWRGLQRGIVTKTLDELVNLGSEKKDLLVWIGPSVKPCCYKFESKPEQAEDLNWQGSVFHEQSKWCIDLPNFALNELNRKGILRESINVHPDCTHHNKNWFSHTRAKLGEMSEGRFATIVTIK